MKCAPIVKEWLALVLCGTIMWTGCSTSWITEAEQIVAALIPATANLTTLVAASQGTTVSASDLQTVQDAGSQVGADLQLMQSLIGQYQKATASAQPGLTSQIQAAISAAQSTLSGLLPALHINDTATRTKIVAVVGLLLSEVESMAAIVPLVKSGASPAMMSMAARQAKKQTPLTANEFVGSYNAIMTAKTGNSELDRAADGLSIHLHNKIARWATAGFAK
jgi:hypothetical protein